MGRVQPPASLYCHPCLLKVLPTLPTPYLCSKSLVGREQLRAAHAGDRAAGLSDRQIADLHAHFIACED